MNRLEAGKISGWQLVAIMIMWRLQTVTVILPVVTSSGAGRDAWLASLIATIAAIPFGLAVVRLGLMHPGETIIQYSRKLLGKFFGTLIGLSYIVFFLFISASVARELGESYTTAIMPETPILVFIVVSLFLASMSARHGIEVIGRMSEIALIVTMIALTLTIVLPFNQMRLDNLLPTLEFGPRPLAGASLVAFSLFGEVISVGMVLPYMNRPQAVARYVVSGIVISGAFLVLVTLTVVAIFGPTTDSLLMPAFNQARMISVAEFLDRLEILPVAAWTLLTWLKMAFFLWIVILGLAQMAGLSDYRPLAYPTGFLTAAMAIPIYDNIFQMLEFLQPEVWGVYAVLTETGITGVLLVASFIRRRTRNTRGLNRLR